MICNHYLDLDFFVGNFGEIGRIIPQFVGIKLVRVNVGCQPKEMKWQNPYVIVLAIGIQCILHKMWNKWKCFTGHNSVLKVIGPEPHLFFVSLFFSMKKIY